MGRYDKLNIVPGHNTANLGLQLGLVSSVLIFTVAYGAGFGAVPYALMGEVFPPHVKTFGSNLCHTVR